MKQGRGFIVIAVLAVGCLAPDEATAREPTKWALLIGVDDYAEVNDLRFAGNDQRALAEQLKLVGFPADQVFLMHDRAEDTKYLPNRNNIQAQLDLVLALPEPGDTVVVAFSGHGVHLDGTSYLLPTDARLAAPAETMVEMARVYQRLEACPANIKLLLVDACRNDPRPGGERGLTPTRGTDDFAKSLDDPPKGILQFTSCKEGQVSIEEPGFRHGVFMHFVLEGLQGKAADDEGAIRLARLVDYVQVETKKHVVRKHNVFQSPTIKGEIDGPIELFRLNDQPVNSGNPVSPGNASRLEGGSLVLDGSKGPGNGKHIVLVSGEEQYRSEEALPQLAKILAKHHGFKCTVLFAIDPNSGVIDPDQRNNIPGLEALASADLMIVFLRFCDLPDEQMKHFVDYVESGRPIIGLRSSTHSFAVNPRSAYRHYDWKDADSGGGFGRKVLGETWIAHHGAFGSQSTRGVVAPGAKSHPILSGIRDGDVWGPTSVYSVRLPLPDSCQPLLLGQVLEGMHRDDKPIVGNKNDPLMPVAWTNIYTGTAGKPARVFTTTMGASQDLQSAGMRRLLVNACYWSLSMEDQITADAPVELVGDFQPLPVKFGGYKKGVRPVDLLKDNSAR
jgi:hypothetical protein